MTIGNRPGEAPMDDHMTLDGGVHPDHPEDKESHVYVGSKARWETISDGLPQFETE